MHIVGHHDILTDPCKHNSWPDMLKELREDVSWGGPLEIPLTEFADSCNVRGLAVSNRKCLTAGEGGEWVKVRVYDFWIRECIADVLRAHRVPSAYEVLGIQAKDLTKLVAPLIKKDAKMVDTHGPRCIAQRCAKTIFDYAEGRLCTASLQALVARMSVA